MFLLFTWLTVANYVRIVNLPRCLLQFPACVILVFQRRIVGVLRAMQASEQASNQATV